MLYQLQKATQDCHRVRRVTLADAGWSEKDLESMVSKRIQEIIHSNDLMTIFTERQWQEEPDILALDRSGDLYIFELKKWSSNKENLLQALRYGQLFGGSSYDELNDLYRKRTSSSENLYEAHKEYFSLDNNSRVEPNDFNKHQHFVVMTNGLDQKTVEGILYWKKNGLNIDAVVYWVYEIGGNYYIEFDMFSPVEGFLEYESSNYVLNTNFSNNPQNQEDMLQEQKAAAYIHGWKEKIDKLQKGDTVFLYQSGYGIIAYGLASGILETAPCGSEADGEHFQRLTSFQRLKKPMPASEMKKVAEQGFPFVTTMYSISDECRERFLAEIKKNYL